MKINNSDLKKVNIIIGSFGNSAKDALITEGKVSAKPHIMRYLAKRLSENYKPIAKCDHIGAQYLLEEIEGMLYLTRIIDSNEQKVLLREDDLKLIKNIKNVSSNELKKLIKKVDIDELRFPL